MYCHHPECNCLNPQIEHEGKLYCSPRCAKAPVSQHDCTCAHASCTETIALRPDNESSSRTPPVEKPSGASGTHPVFRKRLA